MILKQYFSNSKAKGDCKSRLQKVIAKSYYKMLLQIVIAKSDWNVKIIAKCYCKAKVDYKKGLESEK